MENIRSVFLPFILTEYDEGKPLREERIWFDKTGDRVTEKEKKKKIA